MNGGRALDDFLQTDPHDVGCAQAMAMLHIYADLVVAGEPAEQRYPASRRTCTPAARAARTSASYWLRFAARRTDRPA
jgi:hypothetical protein